MWILAHIQKNYQRHHLKIILGDNKLKCCIAALNYTSDEPMNGINCQCEEEHFNNTFFLRSMLGVPLVTTEWRKFWLHICHVAFQLDM
jgi:hypothetical protein